MDEELRRRGPLPDRFAPPKACLTSTQRGTLALGLPDKSHIAIRKHVFEAEKAKENDAAAAEQMAPPGGSRHACLHEYIARTEAQKLGYDDWKPPSRSVGPETLTSVDNPMRVMRMVAQQEPQVAPHGKKTYIRNARNNNVHHLAPSSMEPLSGEELRALQVASRAAGVLRAACGAAGGPGSDAGEGGPVDEEPLPAVYDSVEREAARAAVVAEVAEELALLKELEMKLIEQYPHGVPRSVIMRAQQDLGITLPGLGFGEESCLNAKVARASLRPY